MVPVRPRLMRAEPELLPGAPDGVVIELEPPESLSHVLDMLPEGVSLSSSDGGALTVISAGSLSHSTAVVVAAVTMDDEDDARCELAACLAASIGGSGAKVGGRTLRPSRE